VRLDDVGGFVFDIDGSLVHRGADFRSQPLPGAVQVLESIRASGRPLVLFTNGSHMTPEEFAAGLTKDGLPVSGNEVLTPVCCALSYLERNHPGQPVMVFGSDSTKERMARDGVALTEGEDAGAIFVTHVDQVDLDEAERAARAVMRGAPLLTANYGPGYWGSDGLIFSKGAMVTAAIAKVSEADPVVVGKPSEVAVQEVAKRLGVPSEQVAVCGDDLDMDIGLGKLGGARTILVRSGLSGKLDVESVPEPRRPDAVIDGVEELLPWL
jgi:HAD superfamily hydrolase (TIGR01450 family)